MKSLTDVVSGAGLSLYAEIALVIFLVAFLGVVVSLFVPSRQRMYERLRHLPIDGDAAFQPLYRDDRDSSPSPLRGSARNDGLPFPQSARNDGLPFPQSARNDHHA